MILVTFFSYWRLSYHLYLLNLKDVLLILTFQIITKLFKHCILGEFCYDAFTHSLYPEIWYIHDPIRFNRISLYLWWILNGLSWSLINKIGKCLSHSPSFGQYVSTRYSLYSSANLYLFSWIILFNSSSLSVLNSWNIGYHQPYLHLVNALLK